MNDTSNIGSKFFILTNVRERERGREEGRGGGGGGRYSKPTKNVLDNNKKKNAMFVKHSV